MKRTLFFVLLLSASVSGRFFAAENPPKEDIDKTLYENCLEMISSMHGMAQSELYNSFVFGDSLPDEGTELKTLVKESHYSQPEAVYQLDFPEDGLSFMQDFTETAFPEKAELPPYIKDKIYDAFVSALVFQLNPTAHDTQRFKMSLAYTGEQIFVAAGVKKSSGYLFMYKDSVPVYVSVTTGKDGTVKTQGTFVFTDNPGTLSAETVSESLSTFGTVSVTEVNLP